MHAIQLFIPVICISKEISGYSSWIFYLSHNFYIDVLELFLHILSERWPPKKMVTLSKVQNITVFGTRTYKFYVWYKSLDYFHASLNEIKNQNKWFSFVSIWKHANFYFPSPMKIYLWLCTFYLFFDGTFIVAFIPFITPTMLYFYIDM